MTDDLAEQLEDRHTAVSDVAKWFDFDHLQGLPRDTSEVCHDLAVYMLATIDDCPELTVGLRKLLEAKDCFVRATIDHGRPTFGVGPDDPVPYVPTDDDKSDTP